MSREKLEKMRDCFGVAHDLMLIGQFPGSSSESVSKSIQFLKAHHDDLVEQIKKLDEVKS